jgi:flagellar hook-associated protein 1 FlgK
MSLDTSLYIATGGIGAVDAQLGILSQNLANAATPGYAVESLPQTSVTAGGAPDGVATGLAGITVSTPLQQILMAQNASVAALATTQAGLQPIDAVQGTVGGDSDLGSLVAQLNGAFTTLQSDPSSSAQQSAVVDAAGQLAGQINALGQAYQQARQSAQNSLVGEVGELNADLQQLGTLSDQIVQANQQGRATADLQNQRDAVLQSVSSLVGITYVQQSDGDLLVSTTGGLQLPIHGGPALTLANASLGPDASVELGTAPQILLGGQPVTSALTGGSIGANITLRDRTLPEYQAGLDEFAETLTTRFADQGLTLFTDATGQVPVSGGTPVQSGYVGYSQSIEVNPAVAAEPTLVRDGTNAIAGSPTGASAFTPNTDPTQTGFDVLIERVLNYSFGPQAQAGVPQTPPASSGLGPAGDLSVPYSDVVTLSDTASALVGAQSSDLSTVNGQLASGQAVQTTLQGQFSSGTAVNTDTELSTMIALQNSYGANARVIAAVQTLFQDLLTAMGGA